MADTIDNFEEFAEKVKELAMETRAGVCPVWQCGGELEHLEDRTNWQEPDLRCKNCGNVWHIQKYETCKVEPCHDSKFKGIECLESSDEFGFFKSEADQRPGHAIWIDKEDAERLFLLFKYQGRLLD